MHFYSAHNLPKEKHAFFGRNGGVSSGFYKSLNFNYKSQDKPRNIAENLQIVGAHYDLQAQNVVRLLQSHSNIAVSIDEPSQYSIQADGVVTNKHGIILGITTADCVPVLLEDKQHGVIGAAHAGWRGALYGVIENTVEVMLQNGAQIGNISAAAGPCLQRENFEAKDDMRSAFLSHDPGSGKFFTPIGNGSSYLCDLENYIAYRLRNMGITDISLSGIDTYENETEYFSYRRFCHRKEIAVPDDFPIQLSTIML